MGDWVRVPCSKKFALFTDMPCFMFSKVFLIIIAYTEARLGIDIFLYIYHTGTWQSDRKRG